MKKLLSFLLALCFVIGLIPLTARAQEVTSGTCGKNVTWSFDEATGTLTISGEGEMEDYAAWELAPWDDFSDKIVNVVIEPGVTTVGEFAFYCCTNLTNVTMPDEITGIMGRAFYGCTSLAEITIPDGVTQILASTFNGCTSLTSITLHDNIEYVGGYAFAGCTGLKTVYIGSGNIVWGWYAFSECTSLEKFVVSEDNPNVMADEYGVMYNKAGTILLQAPGAITEYTIPDGVTVVESWSFLDCINLKSINIPGSVTTIMDAAFEGCSSLTDVNLSDGLTYIRYGAFEGCTSLECLVIPDSVESVQNMVFSGCTNLEKVQFSNSMTSIWEFTFEGCSNLKSVVIPDSITEIGFRAFYDCQNLTDVYYTGTKDQWDEMCIDSDNEPLTNATIHYNCSHPGNEYENPFTDIPEDKYYTDPVLWAYHNGITSGTSDTTFGPGNTCTRAHVVTFLWKAAGSPEPETTVNPFSDVSEGRYYYKAVLWAYENGITSGTGNGKFGVNDPCTRAQVVTFLWIAAGRPEPESTENNFPDVVTGKYYYKAVLWAVENGITAGQADGSFGVSTTCTRAHVMTFLYTTVVKNEIELNP